MASKKLSDYSLLIRSSNSSICSSVNSSIYLYNFFVSLFCNIAYAILQHKNMKIINIIIYKVLRLHGNLVKLSKILKESIQKSILSLHD